VWLPRACNASGTPAAEIARGAPNRTRDGAGSLQSVDRESFIEEKRTASQSRGALGYFLSSRTAVNLP